LGSLDCFRRRRRAVTAASLLALALVLPAAAQDTSKIRLDTSETLFSALAAINMCGYDQDLNNSDPMRAAVRARLAARLQASSAADAAREQLCTFYRSKQQPDGSRDLAQYVSLVLHTGPAPEFALTGKEADLPPDASNVLGFLPLLKKFYEAADLRSLWTQLQPEYESRIAQLQRPVTALILQTDLYLKMPMSGYQGSRMVLYLEPMGASSQVNARNYGVDYFLVASPGPGWLKTEQIRHTYLHFVLDQLVQRRANQLKRLDPILELVRSAPLEESYKHDAGLLVVESLIRAIEARTLPVPKDSREPEAQAQLKECGLAVPEKPQNVQNALRECQVRRSMQAGYVLAQHFYDQLVKFEQEPTSMRDAFGDMMVLIDLDKEKKRIAGIQFAAQAAPEVVAASKKRTPQLLDLAEERLAQRDAQGAHRIAQQALEQKVEDPARAMFILGRAATLNKDMDNARMLFERTLQVAREPRMVAWSHIYLGRILDLMCNRANAVSHYRAALQAGDTSPDTKTAADRGIQELPPGCKEEDKDQ